MFINSRRIIGIREISLLFLVLGFLNACQRQGFSYSQKKDEVCFNERCVKVEVVYKWDDLIRGLKFREKMDLDHGMLFIFPKTSVYSFWMKDTKIPLDMIWMDYARRVVHIASNVPPCVSDPCTIYTPQDQALYVLEVNAGYATRHNITVGRSAQFFVKAANASSK